MKESSVNFPVHLLTDDDKNRILAWAIPKLFKKGVSEVFQAYQTVSSFETSLLALKAKPKREAS